MSTLYLQNMFSEDCKTTHSFLVGASHTFCAESEYLCCKKCSRNIKSVPCILGGLVPRALSFLLCLCLGPHAFYTLFPFLPSPFVALAHPFSGLLGKNSPPSSPSKNLVHNYKGRVEGEQKMKEEVFLVWNSTTTPREGNFWAHKYM